MKKVQKGQWQISSGTNFFIQHCKGLLEIHESYVQHWMNKAEYEEPEEYMII